MISCILLAAGSSTRFGSPKALAKIGRLPAIEHLQQTILAASSVHETIIVLGANADQIQPYILNHEKIKSVYNKNFPLGQTSSFQAGLAAVSAKASGFFIIPVDYPFVSSRTFDELNRAFLEKKGLVTIPLYQGKKGHPPLFHAQIRKEAMELEHTQGINVLAKSCHPDQTVLLSVNDEGVILTFNTEEELKKIKKDKF